MEEDEEDDNVDDVSVSGSTWRVILERWYCLEGARLLGTMFWGF
jgi:hypothetical protein